MRTPCAVCGALLTTRSLKQHMRHSHGGHKRKPRKPRIYKPCGDCGKLLASDSLKSHRESQHLDITYDCDLCEKTFKYIHDLQSHIRVIHQGIKKFECEFCPKVFSCSGNRNKHYKTTHKKDWMMRQNKGELGIDDVAASAD